MIQFVCESCRKTKDPKETWILALAADTLGVTSVSREVTVLEPWDARRAVDPLAVHFCSMECKDRYVGQLFAGNPPETTRRKNSATVRTVTGRSTVRKQSRGHRNKAA